MVRFTQRTYKLPSVETFKQMLYDNDIGYKVVDGKLFVRRFYAIPLLLFPEETLMRRSPADRGRSNLTGQSRTDLLRDMKTMGRSEDTLRDIKEKMDSIEGGLRSDSELSSRTTEAADTAGTEDARTAAFEDDSDYLEGEGGLTLRDSGEGEDDSSEDPEDGAEVPELTVGSPEWNAALDKLNIKIPTTTLEQERDALFNSRYVGYRLEESTSEPDLYQYKRTR